MAERTIKHLSFRYTDADGVERHAFQGETLDLPAEEAKRGDEIGAFRTDESDAATGDFDPATASDEELAAWFDTKPTVQDVLDAAGDDPQRAQRLLDAENEASGNDPRKGVVEGLAAIAGRAQ